jgi:hypothetical protein
MADHLGKPVDPPVLYDMLLHWLSQARRDEPADQPAAEG